MKVLGYKLVSYNRKSDNRLIQGMELYTTFESKNIVGLGVSTHWIKQDVIERSGGVIPEVGDEIRFLYDRWQNVADYEILEESEQKVS